MSSTRGSWNGKEFVVKFQTEMVWGFITVAFQAPDPKAYPKEKATAPLAREQITGSTAGRLH